MSRGIKVRDEYGFMGSLLADRSSRIVFAREFMGTDTDYVTNTGGVRTFQVSLPQMDTDFGVIISDFISSSAGRPWYNSTNIAWIRDQSAPSVYWFTPFSIDGSWNNSTKVLTVGATSGQPVGRAIYAYMFA